MSTFLFALPFAIPDFDDLVAYVQGIYSVAGYFIVLAGAFLENTVIFGFFFPGGSLILLGAFYAKQGVLWLPLVAALGWVGVFLGNVLNYWIGRWGIHKVLFSFGLEDKIESHMGAAERFMGKYGAPAILLSHFVGPVRSFVAVTAGVTRFPARTFLFYEGIASFLWSSIFLAVGYILADNLDLVQEAFSRFGLVIGALVVLGIAVKLLIPRLRRRRHEAE